MAAICGNQPKQNSVIKTVRKDSIKIIHLFENDKHMKNYDSSKPSKYIMYLDANNLYGWAMSYYLPTGGFRQLTEKEMKKTDLAKYTDDSKKGLISEDDLKYPQELHDLHNNYALTAEKISVNKNMLSQYCEAIRQKYSPLGKLKN